MTIFNLLCEGGAHTRTHTNDEHKRKREKKRSLMSKIDFPPITYNSTMERKANHCKKRKKVKKNKSFDICLV
jgi:hypothetical protein